MTAIYLDYASTTPLLPEVAEAMQPFWSDQFGNPASAHRFGRQARRAVEDARELIASLLDAHPDEVFFTSGATEANNWAIQGLVNQRAIILTSPLEHPSVTEPIRHLETIGHRVHSLQVTPDGTIDLDDPLLDAVSSAELVACMLVNNETGAIQPIVELRERLSGKVSCIHCDAVQAVGKIPVRFHDLAVTTLSLSAHKFHGPRGIGALLVRRGTRIEPLLRGGHQQMGKRPGTEPVPLIVGLAKALELAVADLDRRRTHVVELRRRFLTRLQESASPLHVNGNLAECSPYIVNISFPGCPGDVLLARLDLAGVACSTGSACSSGSLLPSPALQAMNLPDDLVRSAIRFSFSYLTTPAEVETAADRVAEAVRSLRRAS